MLGCSVVDAWSRLRSRDELVVLTRKDVDLRDMRATREVLAPLALDAVFHAAARVGGIAAKLADPVTYLADNLLLDTSVIVAAAELRIPELLAVGSSAVYPELYERPYVEADLLGGPLESANEGYAIAKIAAAKLCEYESRQHGLNFRVALASNLYGPHDHLGEDGAHLVAAALTKVHRAMVAGERTVTIWGDGTARREFTYSGDVADWLVSQVGHLSSWPDRLNLGCGTDHSVSEYYEMAREVVGYKCDFVFDLTKPSGSPRRLIDSAAARALGWTPRTSLRDGMAATYSHLLATI